MLRIGYWKATFLDEYPAPQWVAGAMSAPDAERVARYLDAGLGVSQSFGLSWCRFGCGHLGSGERSDGIWQWPDGLSHYVRVHQVALPVEFVEHVRENRLHPRSAEHKSVGDDESFWLRWSAELTTDARKARIRRAQAEFLAKVAAIIEPEVERLERTVGVTEKQCAAEGCTGRRLQSGPMCSRCFAVGMGREIPKEHNALVEFLQSATPEDA